MQSFFIASFILGLCLSVLHFGGALPTPDTGVALQPVGTPTHSPVDHIGQAIYSASSAVKREDGTAGDAAPASGAIGARSTSSKHLTTAEIVLIIVLCLTLGTGVLGMLYLVGVSCCACCWGYFIWKRHEDSEDPAQRGES